MKVAVSVKGRFHAFYLAAELERHGALDRLYTSYPRFVAERFEVPRERVKSLLGAELLHRSWDKLPAALRRTWNPQAFLSNWYERAAASALRPGADLFVGWSGVSLAAIDKARSLGMRTLVERGSSHIAFQRDLLREEYERFGMKARLPHPSVVQKELCEYASADAIGVPSHYVRRTFVERGVPEEKLVHVPYGVSLDAFEPGEKEDDVFRVIHVGGINIRKGCAYLMQAFQELNLPNSELWFVGVVNPEIEPIAARYAADNIRFLGPKPQAELKSYYAQASVFSLMSIEEGLAMVTPQAMACGIPVVCSRHTGAEDIVRDGRDGFLVGVRDVEGLKERLLELYDDDERRRAMGASALERVREGFTWRDYGKRILANYSALVRDGAAQTSIPDPRAA